MSLNLVAFGNRHKKAVEYMYDSKQIADRIKSRAKQQGKSIKVLLSECHLGVNTVGNIQRGKDMLTLDCSVDYLLGRTDNPEINR